MEKGDIRLALKFREIAQLLKVYKQGILLILLNRGDVYVSVKRGWEVGLIKVLKYHFHYESLMDVFGVDCPDRQKRFEILYNFVSLRCNKRLMVKIGCEKGSMVESLSMLYESADWLERELWDMYGVRVRGNKNLQRILTDYGFEGHPLLKDFPLSGYVEVAYDEYAKRVVLEPIKLMQEGRLYSMVSSWEVSV